MASTFLLSDVASGADLYFRIWNTAGEVYDFDDNTFKVIGTAVTPLVTATYDADAKFYISDDPIDWSLVWNNGTPTEFVVFAYDNATPADGDDPVTDAVLYTIQFGEIGVGEIVCQCDISVQSTAGLVSDLVAWLERDGQRIVLAAGSATITLREKGSGVDLWNETDASPNAAGRFEMTKNTPGFTSDRIYFATVEITENSTTWTTTHTFKPIG